MCAGESNAYKMLVSWMHGSYRCALYQIVLNSYANLNDKTNIVNFNLKNKAKTTMS